jgi:hypothetical protein
MPRSERDLPAERREAIERVVQCVRRMLAASVRLDGDAATLSALADRLAEAEAELAAHAGETPVDRYLPFVDGDVNGMLPYSPVSGRLNPMAPPLLMEREGERLVGRATFGVAYEGPPNSVHGAWVAAIYDQILALVNVTGDVGGPTASLTVHYRRPTPLHTELHFEAWTEWAEDRKVLSRGRCLVGDELISEAEGLFIRIDAEKAARIWKERAR